MQQLFLDDSERSVSIQYETLSKYSIVKDSLHVNTIVNYSPDHDLIFVHTGSTSSDCGDDILQTGAGGGIMVLGTTGLVIGTTSRDMGQLDVLGNVILHGISTNDTSAFYIGFSGTLHSDTNGQTINYQPVQAVGDLCVYNGISNTQMSLPHGLDGQVLTFDSGSSYGMKWENKTSKTDIIAIRDTSCSSTSINTPIEYLGISTTISNNFTVDYIISSSKHTEIITLLDDIPFLGSTIQSPGFHSFNVLFKSNKHDSIATLKNAQILITNLI